MLAAMYYARGDVVAKRLPSEHLDLAVLARNSAEAALKLKPTLALPHAILSALDRRDFAWASAIEAGKKAVALDPSDSTALLQLGLAELAVGHVAQAADALAAARRVDRYYEHVLLWSVICELSRGNQASALTFAEELSKSSTMYARMARIFLASAAHDRGDAPTAEVHFRAALTAELRGRPFVEPVVHALRSPKAKAEALRALEEEAKAETDQSRLHPILFMSMLGEHRVILSHVSRRLEAGHLSAVASYVANMWLPRMGSLRRDALFKDFVNKIGLVDFWKKHGWPDRCRPKGEDDFECS